VPDRDSYAPGTPSWVDLGTTDVDAAAVFYGDLFGWECFEAGPAEETGGYRIFYLRDRKIAGAMTVQGDQRPPAWSTYVSTDDADAVAERVEGNGGQLFMGPMDVLEEGRMAFFTDPAGAFFGVWQPRKHPGSEIVNEAGALCWNELATRDLGAAKPFYAAVFGWQLDAQQMDGLGEYTIVKLDGEMVGGMYQMGDQFPAEVPSHWMAYFAVDDCDATVEAAKSKGANVLAGPMDIPPGRFATLTDPQGAAFSVIAMRPQEA
jgi:predicted enzyme related to lactoylglutathione lyase